MWVSYKLIDVEIDDDDTGIFHLLKMQVARNESDCCNKKRPVGNHPFTQH